MRRLGVFGGSFDPPHRAHLIVARRALEQARLDEIVWIPAAVPPHKQDERLADPSDRLAMVGLLTDTDSRFRADTLELERPGPSYTVDTVEELRRRYPHAALYLIIGEDSLRRLQTWYRPERILEMVEDVLVYRRSRDPERPPVPSIAAGRYTMLDGDPVDVSSTEIRSILRGTVEGDIEDLVPERVLDYIRSHGLYLSD